MEAMAHNTSVQDSHDDISAEARPLLQDAPSHYSAVPPTETPAPALAVTDEELEREWLAEIKQRPWFRRPSIFWMMPFMVALGIVIGVMSSPLEQLYIKIICKDYLSHENDDLSSTLLANVPSYMASAGSLPTDDRCQSREVLALSAQVTGRLQAISGIILLFTLAKWTTLSDIFGRKFLLMVSLSSISSSLLLTWFAASDYNPFGYRIIYFDGVLQGLVAGGPLIKPALFSYIADCTATKDRSISLGYMLISYACGGIIGPYLGGHIVRLTEDLTIIIRICLVGNAILLMYLFVMPESLRRKRDVPSVAAALVDVALGDTLETESIEASKKKVPFFASMQDSLTRGFHVLWEPLLLFKPGKVPVSAKVPSRYSLILLVGGYQIVHLSTIGVRVLFIPMTNLVFKWTAYEDGIFYSFSALCSFLVFLGVFPLMQFLYKRWIGSKTGQIALPTDDIPQSSGLETGQESPATASTADAKAAAEALEALKMDSSFFLSGTFLYVITFIIVPLFMSVPVLFIAEAIGHISSTSIAASISMLSVMVPSDQTGKAMGALSVSETVVTTLAFLLYGPLFAATSATVPWFYYYVSSGLCLLATLFVFVLWSSY
ncbi:hypothetical protein BGZ98_002581, partial [Dissophora globulifera]